MPEPSTVTTQDGISWHCERQGTGPDLILIPSGEGDCASFAKVAGLLSSSFTVTTFDMPGMSRTSAPASALKMITPRVLASQVVGLMDKLSIESAIVYGCSSGGATALALVAHYPTRIKKAIVHEVPLGTISQEKELTKLDDNAIAQICSEKIRNNMNSDPQAWEALGPVFHARLEKNYVTWIRNYFNSMAMASLNKEEITRRPVSWTVGALTPAGMVFENIVTALDAGIQIGLLPCKHFPQVSIPVRLAEHIRASI